MRVRLPSIIRSVFQERDMMKLTRDEQETHYSQTAQERIDGVWQVYTDDPVSVRQFDDIAERVADEDVDVLVKDSTLGKLYTFKNSSLRVSTGPKQKWSDERREEMRVRARENFKHDS